ncbi:MAG: AAA family ATPase [Planctomycetia bacterium]|nr:AAA family ATPase [Planctomycetia bacterium]
MIDTSLTGHASTPIAELVTGSPRRAPTLEDFASGDENLLGLEAVRRLIDEAVVRSSGVDVREPASVATDPNATIDVAVDSTGPLVLHGPAGTGKSHLCEALVGEWQRRMPESTVVHLAASEFSERYAEAVEADRIDPFRNRFRAADLLVLEDVGKLATKHPAQRELLYTLDALEARGARVVATFDAPPQRLETFLPGLVGRLSGGVVVALVPPSTTSRRAILERIVTLRGMQIEPKALELLAGDLEKTVPELRGILTTLHALVGQELAEGSKTRSDTVIDTPFVRRYLEQRSQAAAPAMKTIAEQSARRYGLTVADLKSGSRRRTVVAARDAAIFLARRLTNKSLQEIGDFFGGRDHTTILHSCRKLEQSSESDPETREAIDAIRQKLARL